MENDKKNKKENEKKDEDADKKKIFAIGKGEFFNYQWWFVAYRSTER